MGKYLKILRYDIPPTLKALKVTYISGLGIEA
jgi:hypothetical protein